MATATLFKEERNPVGTPVGDLDSPVLVMDLDAAARNLQRMKAYAAEHKCLLRPHAKMHKSSDVALWQMREGGAVGMCVQKVSEAEALVAGGVHDVFISNEVVFPPKLRRVAAIARHLAGMKAPDGCGDAPPRLTICCDCVEGVEALARALTAVRGEEAGVAVVAPIPVGVFLEIDVGQKRCGAPPASEQSLAVAQAVAKHPSDVIYFAGIHAYHGAAQHIRTYPDRKAAIDEVVRLAAATKDMIEKAGITVPLVTGAGTGTFTLEATSGLYGELQPGSYLVYDRDYADNADDPDHPHFEFALFVASRVMSAGSAPDVAVVDGGHKVHAIDTGLPVVHRRPDLCFLNGGDEHGVLTTKPGVASLGPVPALNELVWLIPGHCDPTVNLHDRIYGISGGLDSGVVSKIFRVDGRGCAS